MRNRRIVVGLERGKTYMYAREKERLKEKKKKKALVFNCL